MPWFEVLDLSQAQVLGDSLANCEWKPLPRPPFFPWDLSPMQYIVPPEVTVNSYVAVGSCILVSVTGQTGTHMFDTETQHWFKLADRDLPFIKGAIPHGSFFLGLSSASQQITAYKITVSASPPSVKTESLSIVEFPIVTDIEEDEVVVSSGRFVSLGHHGFCSLSCWINDSSTMDLQHTKQLVTMRAYTSQDHFNTLNGNLLVSKQRKHVYSIRDSFRGLVCPCLEAVISF